MNTKQATVWQEKQLWLGAFVGGQSRRMGGFAKGLLPHPSGSGTVVQYVLGLGKALDAQLVLVGNNAAYQPLGLPMLSDRYAGVGPLGGLDALMQAAGEGLALAIACDLPFVPLELLKQLLQSWNPSVPAVLPRRLGGLEPLCALYYPPLVREPLSQALGMGHYGLQRLARNLGAKELVLTKEQQWWLEDWDAPADIRLQHC